MGILVSATVLLALVRLTFGTEGKIVTESEPSTKEDIAPQMIKAAEKNSENPCIAQKTCTDCIRAHPECAWCAKQDINYAAGGKKRCNYAKIIKAECGGRDTVNMMKAPAEIRRGEVVIVNMLKPRAERRRGEVVLQPNDEYDLFLRPKDEVELGIFPRYADQEFPYKAFTVDNPTDNAEVTFYVRCSSDEPYEKRNFCRNVQKGDVVQVAPDIEVLSCPENRDEWNQTIQLYELYAADKLLLTVNLHMICECDCDSPLKEERNSPKCSGRGTYHCGVCSCYDNRYGEECECEGKPNGDTDDDNNACIAPRDTKICSGRGRCHCGICECFNKTSVTGRFCECDSYSCPRSENGQMCGGIDHGKCVCGKCECTDAWTGPACDCKKDIKACRSPYNGRICHGFGDCKCGQCQCFERDEKLHSGPFCADCRTHHPLQCETYKGCFRCLKVY